MLLFVVLYRFGNMVNKTLNKLGGTKWQSKLEVFKQNPKLFQQQIVQWAAIGIESKDSAPLLKTAEFAEFSHYAFTRIRTSVPSGSSPLSSKIFPPCTMPLNSRTS